MDNKKEIQVQTAIVIDFKSETFKGYVFFELKSAKQTEESQEYKEKECSNCNCFLSKHFQLSDDYTTITIDKNRYEIPDFFNKHMLSIKDKKTWQMVFYHIFYNEFSAEIKRYQNIIDSKSYKFSSKGSLYGLNLGNSKKDNILWLNSIGLECKIGISSKK